VRQRWTETATGYRVNNSGATDRTPRRRNGRARITLSAQNWVHRAQLRRAEYDGLRTLRVAQVDSGATGRYLRFSGRLLRRAEYRFDLAKTLHHRTSAVSFPRQSTKGDICAARKQTLRSAPTFKSKRRITQTRPRIGPRFPHEGPQRREFHPQMDGRLS
jgi:hypothetical protein